MAQYQTGTVSLTNGDATVTGSGTAFLSNVSVGDIFQRSGDTVNYFVASVTSDTSLELTTTYSGTSGSGLTYGITRDFTPNQGYPEMFPQDLNTAATFNEAMSLIDEDFAGLGTAAALDATTSTKDTTGLQRAEDLNRFNMNPTGVADANFGIVSFRDANVGVLYIDTDFNSLVTSLTISGTFAIKDQFRGTVLASGISSSDLSLSVFRSGKRTVISILNQTLAGAGMYVLEGEGISNIILG